MTNNFSIVFNNKSKKTFKLNFELYETDIAKKWFDVLAEQVNNNNKIYESDRFYGFSDESWNETKIVSELNKCIKQINKENPVINHLAFVNMSQEHLNQLHHYFEILRGSILSPTDFWTNASITTKKSLERYNVLIHRAEDFYNQKISKLEPRITCTFYHKKRYELHDTDYKHFTLLKNFGEVYINYCEVGKSLLDVYRDHDDIVGEDNIRPLRHYSADFRVHFYNNTQTQVDKLLKEMNSWWEKNHNFLSSLGFYQNDLKNAIGYIPVAKITDCLLTDKEILNKLCEYNTMKTVEL